MKKMDKKPEVKAKPGAATRKAAADKKKANAKKGDAKKTAVKRKRKPIIVLDDLNVNAGVGGLDPMLGGRPGPMGAPGMPAGVDPMMQRGGMGLDPMAMQMQGGPMGDPMMQGPIPPGPQGMPLAPEAMPRKPLPRRRLV